MEHSISWISINNRPRPELHRLQNEDLCDKISVITRPSGIMEPKKNMKCPFCGGTESRVKDSRDIGDAIHRRRECEHCKGRFSTYERVEKFHLMVIKRDQRREPFNRQKLYVGLRKACEKRPLPANEIEKAVEEIEQELYRLGKQEVPSSEIGELVMERLRKMDKIAYIRFASVYRSFGDVETMFEEIQNLLNREKTDIAPRPHPED